MFQHNVATSRAFSMRNRISFKNSREFTGFNLLFSYSEDSYSFCRKIQCRGFTNYGLTVLY